jgi:ribosomal protein L11
VDGIGDDGLDALEVRIYKRRGIIGLDNTTNVPPTSYLVKKAAHMDEARRPD